MLKGHYLLALTFVDPSTEAQAVLDQVCGTRGDFEPIVPEDLFDRVQHSAS